MPDRALRILQVSTADIGGGAEKVAWNLFTRYRARGHDSWLAVGRKRSDDPHVVVVPNRESRSPWYRLLTRAASRLQPGHRQLGRLAGALADPVGRLNHLRGLEEFRYPGTSRLLKLPGTRPDVVHAHNLHGGYFDLRMLSRITRELPVVLTLHDAWLLSGHCAHSFNCERWRTGCGFCPDLTIYPAIHRDATASNWRRKRAIYARSRLHVATPSHWLLRKVEASMLAPAVAEARVLPNGVDLSVFHPADQLTARAALGLPLQAEIVLAAGVELRNNPWKDFETLRVAVAGLAAERQGRNVLLVALGDEAPSERLGEAEIRFIPFQSRPETVARYYQAADVYVHATRADTFPNGVLEALACGVPVVASAVGGIPEQLDEGRTGFLVPPGDASALTMRVAQVLGQPYLRRQMSSLAVATARRRFDLERQVDAYLEWYQELAEQVRPPGR
jgi:glycosyltransferase involved in cell wall biosynthesis